MTYNYCIDCKYCKEILHGDNTIEYFCKRKYTVDVVTGWKRYHHCTSIRNIEGDDCRHFVQKENIFMSFIRWISHVKQRGKE